MKNETRRDCLRETRENEYIYHVRGEAALEIFVSKMSPESPSDSPFYRQLVIRIQALLVLFELLTDQSNILFQLTKNSSVP